MIILEGADNSGKTTLGKDLLQQNPRLEYFHSGSAPRDEEHENMCLLQQYEKAIQPHIIVDRVTCISQQVYKKNRLFEPKLMAQLDAILMAGALIVYCRPSTDRLMAVEHFTWRDEETEEYKQQVIANQHQYIEKYDQLMMKVPHITYDFQDEMCSGWLRLMLAKAPYDRITYHRLREVMYNEVGKRLPTN